MNPLDSRLRAELLNALDAADSDLSARAVLLTGKGASFCAGEDLKEPQEQSQAGVSFMELLERLERMRLPVVAAINGHCIGGGFELAVNCDIRIASTSAQFVCAGVNVGLLASAYRLPRLIGVSRAKAMLLSGSAFSADKMLEFGFVIEVCEADALLDAAMALASRVASRAPLSVEATKSVVDQAMNLSAEDARDEVMSHLQRLRLTEDHQEAVQAFREKRTPQFKRK